MNIERKGYLKRGAGIAGAILMMFLGSPILMLLIGKAIGAFAAIIVVGYLCYSDKRVHWGWRVVAGVVLILAISYQYQIAMKR